MFYSSIMEQVQKQNRHEGQKKKHLSDVVAYCDLAKLQRKCTSEIFVGVNNVMYLWCFNYFSSTSKRRLSNNQKKKNLRYNFISY